MNKLPWADAHGIPAKPDEFVFFRFIHGLHPWYSRIENKKLAGLICIFFFLFYFGTSRNEIPSDTAPATYLPISLIRSEGFTFDKMFPYLLKTSPGSIEKDALPYYLLKQNGHYLSTFPVFSSVLSLPVYIVPVLYHGVTPENIGKHLSLIVDLGKFSASLFTALSVSLVFLSLLEFVNKKKALFLTIIYALGTSSLPISSQSLWQHGASQLFLAASMLLIIKGQKREDLLPWSGLTLGFATLCRFPNIIIALIVSGYFLISKRKFFLRFILLSLPSVFFLAWYHLTYFGNLFFFGYEGILDNNVAFNNPFIFGVLGILFAPSKGLFIYSPIFLFSILGIIICWLNKKYSSLRIFSVVAVIFTVFISKWDAWHGGWSFGPRMLVDITPFFVILLVPVIDSNLLRKKVFRYIFFLLGFVSILIQFFGVIVFSYSWYQLQTMFLFGNDLKRATFLLSWRYPELYYYYLHTGGFFGIILVFASEIFNIGKFMVVEMLVLSLIYLVVKTFIFSKRRLFKNG